VEEKEVIVITDICPYTSINKSVGVGVPVVHNSCKIFEAQVKGIMNNPNVIRRMYITRKEMADLLTARWGMPVSHFDGEYTIDPFEGENNIIYIKPRINLKKGFNNHQKVEIDFWDIIML